MPPSSTSSGTVLNTGGSGRSLPSNGLLVVAHADDEILWFSSILASMARVIVCFLDYPPDPALGCRRRRALAEYPLSSLRCLRRREAVSLDHADWAAPRLESAGLCLQPGPTRERYRRNATWLARRLPALLAGHDAVFSHGPWGEYGHEDHVQLFAVLDRACRRQGVDLWVPSSCGVKALTLARRYCLRPAAVPLRLPARPDLCRPIRDLYQRHGCWTWHDAWRWPGRETFWRASDLERRPLRAAFHQKTPEHVELLPV